MKKNRGYGQENECVLLTYSFGHLVIDDIYVPPSHFKQPPTFFLFVLLFFFFFLF